MSAPSPLLDAFRRGDAPRDARLLAAQGKLSPRAHEQLSILVLLLDDPEADIRAAAGATLQRIPGAAIQAFLARNDAPAALREFFAGRGILPAGAPAADDGPLLEADNEGEEQDGGAGTGGDPAARESVSQQIAGMGFSQRLRAAVKGSREMRALLIRDPNRMIAVSVLSSPKLTEQEVEAFARMANVSEDVLRVIGTTRAWIKNYQVVVGLLKNPKTPLAMSLNLLSRLNDRDLQMLSIDRNVPDPLRGAARRKLVAGASR